MKIIWESAIKTRRYAIVVYLIVTFAWVFVWNLILFPAHYEAMLGPVQRPKPIFVFGIAAILANGAVAIYFFEALSPRGQNAWGRGLTIAILAALPSITYGALVVPAKLLVLRPGIYMATEIAFGMLSAILIGLSLSAVYGASHLR